MRTPTTAMRSNRGARGTGLRPPSYREDDIVDHKTTTSGGDDPT